MTDYLDEDLTWRRPVSTWWWLRKRTYFVFVMRELSSIFVGWFVVFLLRLVSAVAEGAAAYDDFLDWAATPWVVALNLVGLAFVALHTVTWFALTPQAMVVKLGDRPVRPVEIIAGQYLGLVAVSAFVVWLVTR